MIKRVIEGITVLVLLILSTPLWLITAISIRILLGGPVLFVQERTGREMRSFRIYKFRTLTNEADEDGLLLSDELRLTRFGSLLRKLSLDEIPQLINILKGDMSFIGPRPLLKEYDAFYTEEEKKRFTIRPGITGLAQVSGRNMLDWNTRLALDVKYVDERSFWLDMKIVGLTIIRVLARSDNAEVPHLIVQDMNIERQHMTSFKG